MLVVFRAGPRGDRTLEVVDVIPRQKEAIIKARGLGKQAGRYFWLEVDTEGISDAAFNELANSVLERDTESLSRPVIAKPHNKKVPPLKRKVGRKNRLDQNRLEKLDPAFSASTSVRTHDASRVYPKRVLTIRQMRTIVKNKRTGRFLYGH